MLSLITSVIGAIVSWLVAVLPVSPFSGLVLDGVGDVGLYLGWLNWLVPFGDLLALFAAWIAAGLVWASVVWALDRVADLGVRVGIGG